MKRFALSWPLKQKWFWMLFVFFLLVLILPLLIAGVIMSLGTQYLAVILIALIIVWYAVRSYRKWQEHEEAGEGEDNN